MCTLVLLNSLYSNTLTDIVFRYINRWYIYLFSTKELITNSKRQLSDHLEFTNGTTINLQNLAPNWILIVYADFTISPWSSNK